MIYKLAIILTLFFSKLGLSQLPDSGILFNGTSYYYEVVDNSSIDLGPNATIEMWINPCDTVNKVLLSKHWCSGGNGSYFLQILNGRLRWGWVTNGGCTAPNVYLSTLPVVRNNIWQHISVVHTSTSVTLYYNGHPILGSLSMGSYSGVFFNSTIPLRVGSYRWLSGGIGAHYNGRMDELRIWSTARTSAQILANYNSTLIGNETGLQLYHNMENVRGGTIFNSATSTGATNNGRGVSWSPQTIHNNASYPAAFDLGNDTTLCQPNTLPLSIPNSYSSFTWSDGFLSRNRTIGNSGTYIGIGYKDFCFAKDTISISIINCDTSIDTVIPPVRVDTCIEKFVMPNVFSPNGDNINDVLRPVSYDCFNLIEFLVYNRWGQLVFKSREKIEWDGNTLNNSTVTDGTYFWVVSHQNESGHKVSESGFVSVFN